MNRKQFIFTLLLALLSGLMGGVLSIWFLIPTSVLAQDEVPRVIEAQEFRVVAQDGTMRIKLAIGTDGGSYLSLFDPGEMSRVSLTTAANGISLLGFNDDDGAVRAYIGMTPEPRVSLFGDSRDPGISMRMAPEPEIVVFDESGSTVISLSRLDDGNPSLQMVGDGALVSLIDDEQHPRIFLSLFESKPELSISDNQGIRVQVNEEGVTVRDKSARFRAVLGTTRLNHPDTGSTEIRAPSSLVLLDEEGNVVWSAP